MIQELQVLADNEVAVSKKDLQSTVRVAEGFFELLEGLTRLYPKIAYKLIGEAENLGSAISAVRRVRATLTRGTSEGA